MRAPRILFPKSKHIHIAAFVLLSYGLAPIVMGHGAITAVMMFFVDMRGPQWFLAKAIGATRIVGLVIATVLIQGGTTRLNYQCLASIALYASWQLAALLGHSESGSFWSSAILSTSFQIAVVYVASRAVAQRVVQRRASRER